MERLSVTLGRITDPYLPTHSVALCQIRQGVQDYL